MTPDEQEAESIRYSPAAMTILLLRSGTIVLLGRASQLEREVTIMGYFQSLREAQLAHDELQRQWQLRYSHKAAFSSLVSTKTSYQLDL